jgi:Fic family protein
VLAKPVLYLSTYLKQHRTRYFERLMAVREEGDWEGWLGFFLDGVHDSAAAAAQTAGAAHHLRESDRAVLSDVAGTANDFRLLDALYGQPLVNAQWVQGRFGVSPTTANKMLDRLVEATILRETTGKQRYRVYRYDSYLALFDPPVAVEAHETLS